MPRKPGFTVIELIVTVLILTVLVTMVTIATFSYRLKARDAARRSQVSTYVDAINHYRLLNGSDYIKESGKVVGNGSSYGRLNYKYTSTAITLSQALQDAGVLSGPQYDPLNAQSDITSPGQRDYVLIRCDAAGNQLNSTNVTTTDSIFAVWTRLESQPSTDDLTKTVGYCGGSFAGSTTTMSSFGYSDSSFPPTVSVPAPTSLSGTVEYTNKYYASGDSHGSNFDPSRIPSS